MLDPHLVKFIYATAALICKDQGASFQSVVATALTLLAQRHLHTGHAPKQTASIHILLVAPLCRMGNEEHLVHDNLSVGKYRGSNNALLVLMMEVFPSQNTETLPREKVHHFWGLHKCCITHCKARSCSRVTTDIDTSGGSIGHCLQHLEILTQTESSGTISRTRCTNFQLVVCEWHWPDSCPTQGLPPRVRAGRLSLGHDSAGNQ